MSEKTFSKKEAIKFGWETTKSNFKFFLVVLVIIVAVSVGTGILTRLTEGNAGLFIIATIVSWIVNLVIQLGMIKISLKFCDGQKPEIDDIFSQYKLILNFVVASILYGLIVFGGLILLIVPGIIWGIRYSYYSYLIVDKGMGPIQALKESAKVTYGAKGQLFVFCFLLAGVVILGAMALGVGLLWAVPTTIVAGAYVYRKLQKMTHSTFVGPELQP